MLFSSLGKKKIAGEADDDNSSPSDVFPCAIQLYSNKYLDFQKKRSDKTNSSSRSQNSSTSYPYACLTYQAVVDSNMVNNNPAFGVWDLRYNPNRGLELTSLLLKTVALKSSNQSEDMSAPVTILLTVDLSEPKKVYTTLKSTLDVLVQFFATINDKDKGEKDSGKDKVKNRFRSFQGGCCTTTINSLAKATKQFGIAPEKFENIPPLESSYPDFQISLIVAGILPSSKADGLDAPAQSYVEKQAQNLVFYHLHQFAKTANCALVFTTLDDLGERKTPEASSSQPEANSSIGNSTNIGSEINALVKYIHMSTTGQNNPMQSSSSGIEGSNSSQFHFPNSHDEDVISGVMLRNASCEGYWDASKDSLNEALPDSDVSKSTNNSKKKTKKEGAGNPDVLEEEDSWLGALASKMPKVTNSGNSAGPATDGSRAQNQSSFNGSGNGSGSSARKHKGEKKKKATDGAAAESKDVSSFFENLMKPKK